MLTVFNVGQGDSLLLRPELGCKYHGHSLLVDTGPSTANVADRITDSSITVLITHSHADHIGGLPKLLRKKCVKELLIPYYLPEIIRINGYLKRFSKVRLKPLNWTQLLKHPIRLVADGDSLCGHLSVMNPPRNPSDFVFGNDASELEIGVAISILSNLGIELRREEIENYASPIAPLQEQQQNSEYSFLARRFVHRFFISLAESLQHLSHEAISYEINRHVELTANQASIVFKYSCNQNTWLFTGDADEVVFDRLLSERKDISAKYLKVPHHGSRGNISRAILKAIGPQVAIISHNNKKFGRSHDPHPHHEVVDMLDAFGIQTYYTNPVIKRSVQIKAGAHGTTPDGLISFG